MAQPDVQSLLATLANLGAATLLLEGDRVVVATGVARAVAAPVELAERAMATGGPVLVTLEGRTHEATAQRTGAESVVVLLRDVEDREEALRSLARSDEILSLGSHELKGPLHVIGMICHLLENRSGRGEPLDRGTLDRLRRQVARLNRLLNQLLDLSRAQDGRLSIDNDEVDLTELVREQLATVDGGRSADFQSDVAAAARVRGDRNRLAEVIHQLVENALRFTDAGTPITVNLREDGTAWVLTVSDRGAGIPADDQAMLFQRQVRRDRRRGPQGLGLGLYISALVARLHGGTLAFAPTVPHGATFHLRLPRFQP